MKKITLVIIALIVLLMLTSCAFFKKAYQSPTAEYDGVKVKNISFSGAEIVPQFKVYNPNPVGGKIKDVEYRLILDDIVITEKYLDGPIQIKASATTNVEIPCPIGFLDLYRNFENLRGRKVAYRLEGSFKLFTFTFPIIASGEIQVPDLPNIRITDLDIENGMVSFNLLINSKDGTAMDIKKLAYSVKLNNKMISSGKTNFDKPMQSGESRKVRIESKMSLMELAELGLLALEKGRLSFHAEYEAVFDVPGQGKQSISWEKEGFLGD